MFSEVAQNEMGVFLELLMENIESGIMLVNSDTYEVIDVNDATLRIYGGKKEDMIGEHCNKFFGHHICPLAASNEPIYRCERKFTKADGTVIPVIKTAKYIKYKGESVILETFDDISSIKEVEEKGRLLEQSNNMQILLDSVPIGCKLWNKDLKIIECNETCVRLFGTKDKKEFIDGFFDFSPKNQPNGRSSREMAVELIAEALEKGTICFEWMHQKKDGTKMPSEITMVRVEYQGENVIAAYIRDLTEEQKMLGEIHNTEEELRNARNEAESANQAKSMFLANMSHEMRTPLNVVVGLTALYMEEEKLPVEVQTDIKKINTAGATLLGLVNDVLDISKIEAGKLELVPVKYDSASLFNDIITLNMIRIESKPIVFNVEIDENLPKEMFGDELRLKQIFNNLLSNAFKYTREGSVTLKVSCERKGKKDIWMNASVSDTGIGIKPEDIEKLFSDYNQVDTKANRKIEGTGLGLSITKKMLELMDGTVTVESEYGKGSTFRMRAKQGFVNDKPLGKEIVENLRSFTYADNKPSASSKLVREDMSYARVLVVDDVQTNLDVASGMMKKYKLHVDCVTSGQAAIDRIRKGEPLYDAVFMDHMMPEMDGIEATKAIRALDSEYAKTVKIISLTANAVTGSEKMFLDSGFQAFLSKPIDMMQLDMILKKWVRDKSKEALLKKAEPEPEPEPDNSSLSFHIPEINKKKGLALYGNDEGIYMSVIRSYAANTTAIIEKLRNVTQDNLREYAINVHGLKSTSGAIGAEGIRERAAKMEAAAKEEKVSEVLAENEALLKDTEALVSDIKAWLSGQDEEGGKPRLQAPDTELLETLLTYCEQYDMDGVDDAMEKIESFSYDTDNDFVIWLREETDTSDLSIMAGRIKEKILARAG